MNDLVPAALSGLAEQINEQHRLAIESAMTAIDHACKAGELLSQAKDRLGHGEWLPWLKANVPFTPRTAQNYLRLAKERPRLEANAKHVSHLPIRDALAMLANPPDDGELLVLWCKHEGRVCYLPLRVDADLYHSLGRRVTGEQITAAIAEGKARTVEGDYSALELFLAAEVAPRHPGWDLEALATWMAMKPY